jgi:FKBP-type peptidyl-prolyl cis-trans isomerase 2
MITETKILATTGTTVRLRYTIRPDQGRAFPPTDPDDLLEVELGTGRVLPGIDRALRGMSAGERKVVRVPAAEAFGPRRPDRKFRIARPDAPALRVGDAVRVRGGDESSVVVDANHPLSGQDLTFEIEVLDVSLPSGEPGLVA